MKKTKMLLSLVLGLAVGLVLVGAVRAQIGNGYDLTWHTIDGGGGMAIGGGYTLEGTVGQPDAGAALTGGGYTLYSGFWPASGATDSGYRVYVPLVVRDH